MRLLSAKSADRFVETFAVAFEAQTGTSFWQTSAGPMT
jgi:hypothetical protein